MRLLVISKMHPPGNSTRAIQVGRMLEALRAQGADITVITEETETKLPTDDTIIRLPSRKVKYASRLLHRISRTIEHHVDMTNPYHRWTRGAVEAASKLIDRQRPDVVLTLSWPFNPHMVGLELKRRYPALPWAAFLSDPFPATIIGGYWDRYPVPVFSRHQVYSTKKVLHRADLLIMPNALAPSVFCSLASQPILDSFITMPHIGAPPKTPQPVEPGWLTHIGTLDPPRCCEPLLVAIKELAETDPSFKGLRLVGIVSEQFIEQAEALGISHLLDRVGSVPSEEAQRIAQRSQALLILEADLPKSYFLPSKLADYVYVNRPIFAITPPLSTIRNYFRPFPVGEAVAWHSPTLGAQLRAFWQRSMSYTDADFQGLQALYDPERNAQQLLTGLKRIQNTAGQRH
jgi:glycosyltransferase involved in cell wall biosynthesis